VSGTGGYGVHPATHVITAAGSLWGTGSECGGVLGNGVSDGDCPVDGGNFDGQHRFIPLSGTGAYREVHGARTRTVALTTAGDLHAWGSDWGATPSPLGTGWKTLAAGYDSFAGIKNDGTLWMWGYGQCGLGGGTEPAQVGTDDAWAFVAIDLLQAVAIKADGSLWSWGCGGYLGLGDDDDRTAPTRVGKDSSWTFVDLEQDHTLALKADGTLWAWGQDSSGNLGLGKKNGDRVAVPTQVGSSKPG
jgi:hypothetical protein